MPFPGLRFTRTPRCCIWACSWSSGPGFASSLPLGEHHEAALLWGSVLEIQHYQPPPPGLIEGLPPGVLAVRTMPCSEVGCQGCLQGRWGFCFPFVGTYAGSSLVVAAGVSPAQAWDDFHSHEEPRLAAVDVLSHSQPGLGFVLRGRK